MQLRSDAARDSADAPNAAEQSDPEETQHGLGKKETTQKKDELVYKSKQVPSPN